MTRDPSAPGPSAAVRDVTLGSLIFRVTDTGPPRGRPVLLLHGFPQTSWCWRHVVPALATAGHRVLTLDQRGYSPGACPEAVEDYAGEHLVSDVTGILDVLGIESVDLVGHDWGAAVAWQVAGYHPERVTTLTAISVPHPGAFMEALASDPDQQARSAYLADFATPGYERALLADDAAGLRSLFGDETAVDVDHVLSRLGTETQLRPALNWYAAQSARRALATPHSSVPTLHIWSDADPALGAYGARTTHRYVTGPYRLVTLRDVGHWIPEAAPQQTADLVSAHLTQH
ncbi:alpha/beta hydrolase [Nocardioides sp.]|uniref:alpha/beta fold hydrolase n=1 Tax=Nocardioides sp. TaxID=35761 RepID=UPI002BF85233|nr:alpha/beta hydrolase [Nocardioides sp.]HXH79463.1 alpha/beta hydrolase [Nocardioides sp.]